MLMATCFIILSFITCSEESLQKDFVAFRGTVGTGYEQLLQVSFDFTQRGWICHHCKKFNAQNVKRINFLIYKLNTQ